MAPTERQFENQFDQKIRILLTSVSRRRVYLKFTKILNYVLKMDDCEPVDPNSWLKFPESASHPKHWMNLFLAKVSRECFAPKNIEWTFKA